MMKKPFVGTPVSYADYFKGGFGTHLTGILGGIIWGVGMSFNIIAAGRAGFAISYRLGPGRNDGGSIVGRVHLEGIHDRPAGNIALDCRHVWLFPGRARADHHGANVVASRRQEISVQGSEFLSQTTLHWPKPIGSPVLESVRYAIESSRDVQTQYDKIVDVASWMAYEELPMPEFTLAVWSGPRRRQRRD